MRERSPWHDLARRIGPFRAAAGSRTRPPDDGDEAVMREGLGVPARHDPLTGLAGRSLFLDRLDHALRRVDRYHQQPAVLLVDVDDFKTVNDTLGHLAGDGLLVAAALRLAAAAGAGTSVARLGDDEFAVLIEDCHSHQDLQALAERVMAAMNRPVRVGDHRILVSQSVGAALASTGMEDADDLLRDASAALLSAKRKGRGGYALFTPGMHTGSARRGQLQGDLRSAIKRQQLRLLYQPTVALADRRICGVEALLRWQHPTLGAIPATDLIPLAEESDLIVDLGRWVLNEACEQARRWRVATRAAASLLIHVNLSARQLDDDRFVDDVRAALQRHQMDPSKLVLELTESMLLSDLTATAERLREVKRLGVLVAIDDFGTGYSALSYLHHLPVDLIKIDKSFVTGITSSNGRQSALVEAVVQLVQRLGLRSVAEGIEHEDEAGHLQQLRCQYGQGYLFAPPLHPDDIPHVLAHAAPVGAADVPSGTDTGGITARLTASGMSRVASR